MKKYLAPTRAIQRFTGIVAIGVLCLGLIPPESFAHWRPGGASRPSSSPRPPVRPHSSIAATRIQAIRDRLAQQGMTMSQEQLDRLNQLDEKVWMNLDAAYQAVYGYGSELTFEQKQHILDWIVNIEDIYGEYSATLSNVEWHERAAYITENIGLVVSISKVGVIIIAAVTVPGALPAIIAVEGAITKAEYVALAAGNFTAALQDGINEGTVTAGLTDAGLAVTVKLASGALATRLIPAADLGTKVLHNLSSATQEQLIKYAAANVGQEGVKVTANAVAENLLGNNTQDNREPPVQIDTTVTRPSSQSDSGKDVSVQTTVTEFTLSPELVERMNQNAQAQSASTSPPPDEVGQAIQGYLDTGELIPPTPQVSTVKTPQLSQEDLQLFSNPPTLPPPTPATSATSVDHSSLFVTPRPKVNGARP